MTTPEDSTLLATTTNTTVTTQTPNTAPIIAYGVDQSINASYAYNNIIASTAATSLIASSTLSDINAIFTVSSIKTYVDLASPSIYLKLISAFNTEYILGGLVESFKFDINKVLNYDVLYNEDIRAFILPKSIDNIAYFDNIVNNIDKRVYEDFVIYETISFKVNSDLYDVTTFSEQLYLTLRQIRNDTLALNLSDNIDNIKLNPSRTEAFHITDDIRFDFNKDMFEVAQFYEYVRPKIKPLIEDNYIFSPTDTIEEIMLRISSTSYLRIEEYISYMFSKNQYENVFYSDILNSTLETSASDNYGLDDNIDNILIDKWISDVLREEDYWHTTLHTSVYDSYSFLEFIPDFVQRVSDGWPIEEYYELKEIDALRLQTLDVTEHLYLKLKRTINDTINPIDSVLLKLNPHKTEIVDYSLTISGFVDNYFEPGYCDLGYAGIPI